MNKWTLGLFSVFCISLVSGCNHTNNTSSSLNGSSSSTKELSDEEYFENFDPVLRFSIASDIHIHKVETPEDEKLVTMMEMAYSHARNSKSDHKTLDAMLIAGDLMEHGEDIEFYKFYEIFYDNINLEETQPFITMGNHEFEFRNDGDPIETFKYMFECEIDEHTTFNGYHFIRMSPSMGGHTYDGAKQSWLLNELKKAQEDTPDKPIFLMTHHAVLNTVYGTEQTIWGSNDLRDILTMFPQVVHFSGHSHFSMTNPKSVHQLDFTSINVGPLAYFSLAINDFKKDGVYPTDKEGGYATGFTRGTRAGEFAVCEVDKNGALVVYCYDVYSGEVLCTYQFRDLVHKENFKNNAQKKAESMIPEFKEDSELELVDVTTSSVKIKIPAAVSEEFIESYRVYAYDENGDLVSKGYALSGEIFRPKPEYVYCNITGLKSNTDYKLEVYAVNAYDKLSEKPLYLDVTTG